VSRSLSRSPVGRCGAAIGARYRVGVCKLGRVIRRQNGREQEPETFKHAVSIGDGHRPTFSCYPRRLARAIIASTSAGTAQ